MPEPGAETGPTPAATTVARWFGPPRQPLMGWLSSAAGGSTDSGVLVLPPVGYEWWSTHRTVRTVAERLAAAGHTVLRIDYDGTGDSAGEEATGLAAWSESARAGAAELRGLGCRRLTVLGARFGGLLGLCEGAELEAEAVVAWAPPASGKRLARELRMLSQAVPGEDGAVAVSGMVFGATLLEQIGGLDPRRLQASPAPRVALVGPASAPLVGHLRELGVEVSEADPPGAESALGLPAEDATVPEAVVAALLDAVGPADGERLPSPPELPEASFAWSGGLVRERVVRLGPERLVGVLTTPGETAGESVLVWLNSGSEPHVGPGRAWVEYARALALRGHATLRLDFSGWGESPDLGHAPGRPYDPHGVEEAAAAVAALHELGYRRVVLAGLCAGAWVALRAALSTPLAGVLALNPQLYWRPGDPVEALLSDTRKRRTAEREREERGGRLGLWTLLDRIGQRPWAAGWLDALAATEVPVLLLFAADDDGIEYLRNRFSRRLERVTARGRVRVAEIPEIDHSMHRAWLRDRVAAAAADFLDTLG